MAISTSSSLLNKYRYFTLAINSYDNKCLQGVLYHDSRTKGIICNNLVEIVAYMAAIFHEVGYPKQVVEMRRFKGTPPVSPVIYEKSDEGAVPLGRKGKLANFRIYVKHCYHAGWQGELVWLDENKTMKFDSFMNLVLAMDRILDDQHTDKGTADIKKTCRVAVQTYDRGNMTGEIRHYSMNEGLRFRSVIELLTKLEGIMAPVSPHAQQPMDNIVSNKALTSYRVPGNEATFVVRFLFRDAATWQGTIYWKESGEQVCFRSFLELIMLMISALESKKAWVLPIQIDLEEAL